MTEYEKEIILAYAKNNMDVCKTARFMYKHSNTVRYHLDKMHNKYGLNPYIFFDLVELVKIAKGSNDE